MNNTIKKIGKIAGIGYLAFNAIDAIQLHRLNSRLNKMTNEKYGESWNEFLSDIGFAECWKIQSGLSVALVSNGFNVQKTFDEFDKYVEQNYKEEG